MMNVGNKCVILDYNICKCLDSLSIGFPNIGDVKSASDKYLLYAGYLLIFLLFIHWTPKIFNYPKC